MQNTNIVSFVEGTNILNRITAHLLGKDAGTWFKRMSDVLAGTNPYDLPKFKLLTTIHPDDFSDMHKLQSECDEICKDFAERIPNISLFREIISSSFTKETYPVRLVAVSPSMLGYRDSVSFCLFLERAQRFGLELCNPGIAVKLFLKMRKHYYRTPFVMNVVVKSDQSEKNETKDLVVRFDFPEHFFNPDRPCLRLHAYESERDRECWYTDLYVFMIPTPSVDSAWNFLNS